MKAKNNKQMDIYDFIEKPLEAAEIPEPSTLFERLFEKLRDPVIKCANCLCERCINNVEKPWNEVLTEEQINPCFNCDECRHYTGDIRHRSQCMENCCKFEISDYAAAVRRKKIKIVKR